jgi:hypothetical protein
MALGPTQPLIQWITRGSSLGVKWLGCEADHSPPSSAKVKEYMELYLHSLNMPSWCGAQLKKKHRDNFTFYLYLYEEHLKYYTETDIQIVSNYIHYTGLIIGFVSSLLDCIKKRSNMPGLKV